MSYLRSNKLEKEVTEWFLQVFLSIFFTRFLERPFAFEKVSERYSFDRPCVAGMGRHGSRFLFKQHTFFEDTFPCSRANREKDTGTRRTRRKKRPIMNLLFLYSFSRKNSIKVGLSINWTTA